MAKKPANSGSRVAYPPPGTQITCHELLDCRLPTTRTMDQDTKIGGAGGRFPQTQRSLVLAAASGEDEVRERAFEALVAAYWKPVYKYVRIKWRASNEEAKDHTQEFFTRALEKEFFRRYDPARAGFRTYLRTCLDAFLANEHKAAGRLKRGGGTKLLPLDFEDAEGELREQQLAGDGDPEETFHQEWVRSLFGLTVDALRRRCKARGKEVHFELFRCYDLEPPAQGRPTYAELARRHDLPVTQVTNFLAAVRRDFRRLLLDKLKEITGSDEEYRQEARALLGIDPP